MTKYFIGIDPGLTGAIALVDDAGVFCELVDLPIKVKYCTKQGAIKNCIDAVKLEDMLNSFIAEYGDGIIVFLEDVHGRGGWSAPISFGLGETIGALNATLNIVGLEVNWITPTFWKKYFKVTSNKEGTLAKANSMYPEARKYISRKKDHNRAEALLIARYAVEITRGPLK